MMMQKQKITVVELKWFDDGGFEEIKRYEVSVTSARGLRMLCSRRGIKNADFFVGACEIGYVRQLLDGSLYFWL